MDKSMKFSVSMCVYWKDDPEWFKTAVDSILHQTCEPDEVVLVVDGPVPDELGTVINEYEKNPVFKVIRLAENQGHGNARRIGLENCTNELVALMDADDISVPERFAKQLEGRGIRATVRRKLGADINASCGQLRREDSKEK